MKFSETRISDNNTTHMGLPEVWFSHLTLVARSTFSGDSMGGMGGQGGFRGNIDPEELFRSQVTCFFETMCFDLQSRTIFGDRSGGNPFAGGINFGHVR